MVWAVLATTIISEAPPSLALFQLAHSQNIHGLQASPLTFVINIQEGSLKYHVNTIPHFSNKVIVMDHSSQHYDVRNEASNYDWYIESLIRLMPAFL